MSDRDDATRAPLLQQQWGGWGPSVGLGLFLLQIGALTWLVADGLSILSAI